MTAKAARTFALRAWFGVGLFAALVFCAHAIGLRINESPSLPIGIWRVSPVDRELQRGDIVSFCPPDTPAFREAWRSGYLSAGHCEGGYEPLLKPVAAIAGDRVSGTDDGISINGCLIASSKSLNRDGLGRTLPSPEAHDVIVAKGEVWVISSYNPLSFDSRYFGPVPISRIEGLAHPLFVFHPLRDP
jgi:conjugative transfer signal peptidase TraF